MTNKSRFQLPHCIVSIVTVMDQEVPDESRVTGTIRTYSRRDTVTVARERMSQAHEIKGSDVDDVLRENIYINNQDSLF